ncbi:hybrid sensor histidine kinase/response regulator transcription factor [Paenibacillus polymyxa]|uniref:hybrid sensor histidine kinase/response regulator transcription factor n=1 Tax=Paenibacillus polymyxa TaxID=1406 RepID=UPI003D298F4F
MLGCNMRWSWQEWIVAVFRILWLICFVLLSYQDRPSFPFTVVFISVLVCYSIPLFIDRIHYRWYLLAEVFLVGGISLLFAHQYELVRLFLPAVFTISFYSRGRSHAVTFPLALVMFCLGGRGAFHWTIEDVFQNLVDASFVYGIGFGLQMAFRSIDRIKQKLELIKKQYQTLEQYSTQVEQMTLLEERYRMARELHDSIGHTFTSIILGMETLRPYISSEEGTERLQSVLQLGRTGLEDIRKQVHQMDPMEEDPSLDLSLLNIINEFKKNTAIRVVFRTMGEPLPVIKQSKLTLYRCLQELLTNASRHGHANSIQVLLHYDHNQIILQVQDNGKGSDEIKFGFGLSGMKERLSSLQGKLYLHSKEGEGTIVTCSIPLLQDTDVSNSEIKVLLVDDQLLIRDSLGLLLKNEPDFRIQTAEDGNVAVDQCASDPPDVVLMDVHMPQMDGITATKLIKESWPNIRVIMITTFDDISYATKSLALGAEGYVLKSIDPRELANTIRLVHHGGTMITQEVASTLFQQMTGTMKNPYGLTERELEILHCLTEGHRYKAIASKVHLSEGTVRNYISTIYSKMQVQSRDEAIEKAKTELLTDS